MPYTKEALQNLYSLSLEDVNATLAACRLPTDKNEYPDEEIHSSFDIIRKYFTDGQACDYQQAAELFEQAKYCQPPKPNSQSKAKKKNEKLAASKPKYISELLSNASEQVGVKISLTEAIKILQACGLSCDSEQYSQQECERFLEACDLYKKQGKSYQEVAAHFGVNFTGASQQNNVPDIIDSISDSAASSEAGLINLVDKVTEKRAENIPGLVNQMYLKNVARQLTSSQDDIQSFYAGLEERILDQIEGKSPLSSIMGTNWETKPLQPSSEKPMQLPPESENGTRDE